MNLYMVHGIFLLFMKPLRINQYVSGLALRLVNLVEMQQKGGHQICEVKF